MMTGALRVTADNLRRGQQPGQAGGSVGARGPGSDELPAVPSAAGRIPAPREDGAQGHRSDPPDARERPTDDPPHERADPNPDARDQRLARLIEAWWREERPAWTEADWWEATLRDEIRRLLWLAPGPDLVAALAALPTGEPCPLPHTDDRMLPHWPVPGHAPGWPCACQVVVAAAWDACASWLATCAARALVDAAGPHVVEFDVAGGMQQIADPAREELACALRTALPAMGNRIGAARSLCARPRLLELVQSGAISAWAGRLVCDHLVDLDDAQAAAVVADVEQRVRQRLSSGRRPYNSAEVNRLARGARLRVCPETEMQARVRSFATRRVVVQALGNGMASLVADLSDVDAHRIHRRLTALAQGLQADAAADGTPDPRTRDQLRADVLTDLLLASPGIAALRTPAQAAAAPEAGTAGARERVHGSDWATEPTQADPPAGGGVLSTACPSPAAEASADVRSPGGPLPGACAPRSGGRPDVQVIIRLETLLGLDDDPAELTGLGPIPAGVARVLAADGQWRAWITDASGAVTATGSRGYVPGAALARLVRAREPHCRFPGCRQPASRCDLDHAIPWPAGATSAANLGPLCRRHHVMKTHAPWLLEPDTCREDSPSGWRWHTPAGLVITDGPQAPLGVPPTGPQ
jgi:hypothetical protein